MRFFCVTRDDLSEINDSLRRACEARDVEYVDVRPTMLWLPLTSGPQPGDLLYRPATDAAAEATEAVLRLPGVVTFDREPGLVATAPLARYVQAGLPVPRTVFNLLPRRQSLTDAVEALGGLPVILKAPGGEGGAGVIRVDTWDTLFALADYLPSTTVIQDGSLLACGKRRSSRGRRSESRRRRRNQTRAGSWRVERGHFRPGRRLEARSRTARRPETRRQRPTVSTPPLVVMSDKHVC